MKLQLEEQVIFDGKFKLLICVFTLPFFSLYLCDSQEMYSFSNFTMPRNETGKISVRGELGIIC